MDIYERSIIIGSLGVACIVLFTPLLTISSNNLIEQGSHYVFLAMNISLRKSFIIMEGSLVLSLLWLFHNKFKVYIVENLGFQGNNYLFLCLLYLTATGVLISIGDVVSLFSTYTMVVTLTPLYYVVLIVLILLLSLCVYLSFLPSHKYFKGHVVGYHGKKPYYEKQSDGSLFDSIQHDDV